MAKKVAAKKKPAPKKEIKATFDLFVYRKRNNYSDDRVYVLPPCAAHSVEVSFDTNGTPIVEVSSEPNLDNALRQSYCSDFMEQTGCGELPPNTLVKWSITASVVPTPDKKALQKQILEAALRKLE